MCGVFGICYGPNGPEGEPWTPSELLGIMFPAIVHRGHHAWGYMYYESGAEGVDFFKKGGSATHKLAAADMTVPDSNVSWLVGHVRFATNGSPSNNSNNHPIIHGDVMGVHNGKLNDWQRVLDETGREDPTAQVDSEAIFAAVNKFGLLQGLRQIRGDMVSIFTNVTEPEKLQIARTHGRPLVYATTEAGSFIFASEMGVLTSTGIEFSQKPIDWLEGNKLMTVERGEITKRVRFRKVTKTPAPPARDWSSYRSSVGYSHTPVMMFQKDKHGGTYMGGNLWRVTEIRNGYSVSRQMNAEDYVSWCVERALTAAGALEPEATTIDVDPVTPPKAITAGPEFSGEQQALAVVGNNGNS